ncbi:hypothetical protein [Undibacterium sp. Di24W]|uniref:hypothetical protein n=1 Tax=Undibacterium sp. Di24W TaxID=3413033 RepID=UPI003BEFF519
MTNDAQRKITEEEVLFVEEAFSEFEAIGSTEKKCPWCDGKSNFVNAVSAYSIHCTKCEFKVTARGI